MTTCATIATQAFLADSGPVSGWLYVLVAIFGSPFLVAISDWFKRREWSMQRTLGSLQARVESLEKRLDRVLDENRALVMENITLKTENIGLKSEVNSLLVDLNRPGKYDHTGQVIIIAPLPAGPATA
ncbi:hypothetical protein BH09PLA1_BH09PLA1_25920 [soil metagenome]